APVLATSRSDAGAARDEESSAHHRNPDPLLWDLRAEELATRGDGRGAACLVAVWDLTDPLSAAPGGDGVAGAGQAGWRKHSARALRFRCDAPADPGCRLLLRGSHDLPAPPAGCRGPAARPVSSPTADRRRRDGRSLPGRASAPET